MTYLLCVLCLSPFTHFMAEKIPYKHEYEPRVIDALARNGFANRRELEAFLLAYELPLPNGVNIQDPVMQRVAHIDDAGRRLDAIVGGIDVPTLRMAIEALYEDLVSRLKFGNVDDVVDQKQRDTLKGVIRSLLLSNAQLVQLEAVTGPSSSDGEEQGQR